MSRVVCSVLSDVFTRGNYILLTAATALPVLILTTWLPNLGLVWQVVASDSIPFPNKIEILAALVQSLGTNFTPFSGAVTIAMAVLFGANVTLIVYYLRLRRTLVKHAGSGVIAASVGGLASGLLGVGCAACGTLILSPALTFLGAGTVITSLPFGGEEFGLLGVAMLVVSLIWGAKRIAELAMCRLEARVEQ